MRELFLGDGEPERVAVLRDDERLRLGALVLAEIESTQAPAGD